MQFTPAIKPETIMQQSIRSMRLYFKAFLHVFFFAFLLSIVVFIPRILTLFTNQDLYPTTFFAWSNLLILLVDIGALILFTSMLWRIKCRITERHESFIDDLMVALKKTPQILVAVVIQVFVIILLNLAALGIYMLAEQHALLTSEAKIYWLVSGVFFLQSIALLYLYFLFFFYLALILTEDQTAFSALKKSVMLVWKNWWRTFLVQCLPWLVYFILLIIIRDILHIDINLYFFQMPEVTIMIVLLQLILFALFIPWPAATMLVQLRDLELRKNI